MLGTEEYKVLKRNMGNNFVIIGPMRSGSSSLCSYLDSHPDITCKFELLHRNHYKGTIAGVHDYLASRVFDVAPTPFRGFKMLYHQMWGRKTPDCYMIQSILKSFGCKVIHLTRRNHFESFVSKCLARRSKVWNVFRTKKADKHFTMERPGIIDEYNRPITVNPEEYLAYIQKLNRWQQAVNELYHDCFKVSYETLEMQLYDVADFLGAPRKPMTCDTIKLRTKSMSEVVSNYDEVKDLLPLIEREVPLLNSLGSVDWRTRSCGWGNHR